MPLSWVNAAHHYLRFSRCAVGIEIQPTAVRVVILSRYWQATAAIPAIRIEHIAQRELPIGAVLGAELADVMEIAAAIVDVLSLRTTPKRRPLSANRAVMALPNEVILLGEASVAQLAQSTSNQASTAAHLDTLAPAVHAEAERLFKTEATELAIDWFQPAAAQYSDQLMIAAAPRHYVEACLEVAAQAGLQLIAIDEENAAVLRACRFAAHQTLPPAAFYSVIWLGMHQSYTWFVRQHHIEQTLLFSHLDLVQAVFIDKLRHQAQAEAPQQAFIAGEIAMLNTLGLSLEEIGLALRCKACAFDVAVYCHVNKHAHLSSQQAAPFALAFGLALRGALEP